MQIVDVRQKDADNWERWRRMIQSGAPRQSYVKLKEEGKAFNLIL